MSPDVVTADRAGRQYVLLCTEPDMCMTQEQGGETWRVASAYPTRDAMDLPAVGFVLDERGARQMGLLTSKSKGRFLAIVLDDEVCTVPIIRSTIYETGIIQGNFSNRDVNGLVRILNSGSRLRLPVVFEPISAPLRLIISVTGLLSTLPAFSRAGRLT